MCNQCYLIPVDSNDSYKNSKLDKFIGKMRKFMMQESEKICTSFQGCYPPPPSIYHDLQTFDKYCSCILAAKQRNFATRQNVRVYQSGGLPSTGRWYIRSKTVGMTEAQYFEIQQCWVESQSRSEAGTKATQSERHKNNIDKTGSNFSVSKAAELEALESKAKRRYLPDIYPRLETIWIMQRICCLT